MSRSVFDPPLEALPAALPVFPLSGALLLPGGRLPLNIFEPRYLNMINDALAGDRVIGMVQPIEQEGSNRKLYGTGCAGRIIAFSETDDGRYLITLQGLIRFGILRELTGRNGYRRVKPDYQAFRDDLEEDDSSIDRDGLLSVLKGYFDATGIEGDWEAIERAPNERLITTLAMGCPFDPPEKQALLEAVTLDERSSVITAILSMATHVARGTGISD